MVTRQISVGDDAKCGESNYVLRRSNRLLRDFWERMWYGGSKKREIRRSDRCTV